MKDGMYRNGSRDGRAELPALTVEEHLWLHRMMEQRAHELWLAGGGRRRPALENWLQAERETWGKFKRIPAGSERNVETGERCAKRRAHGRANAGRR